jgi:hypothetical protein
MSDEGKRLSSAFKPQRALHASALTVAVVMSAPVDGSTGYTVWPQIHRNPISPPSQRGFQTP